MTPAPTWLSVSIDISALCRSSAANELQAQALTIVAPQARLDVEVIGLPPAMLLGELKSCTLSLRNAGSGSLRGIRLITDCADAHLAPRLLQLQGLLGPVLRLIGVH